MELPFTEMAKTGRSRMGMGSNKKFSFGDVEFKMSFKRHLGGLVG